MSNEYCIFWGQILGVLAPLENEIILTTAYQVIGRKMLGEAGIITAECVLGSNIFKDIFAGVRDIVGGRAAEQQGSRRYYATLKNSVCVNSNKRQWPDANRSKFFRS